MCTRMLWTRGLQCCPCCLCCCAVQSVSGMLSSHPSSHLPALTASDAMLQAAEEAQQRIEQAAAEAAKQAPEKGDIAAQVVRGTAQGVKREAVPTAEVRHRLHWPAQSCLQRAWNGWGCPVPWEPSREALPSCTWQDDPLARTICCARSAAQRPAPLWCCSPLVEVAAG